MNEILHTEKEYILCSAIHYIPINLPDNYINRPVNIKEGFVICGRRHSDCIYTMYILSPSIEFMKNTYKQVTQGFLTNTNRFVDREEAFGIASNNNQLKNKTDKKILFSEDLY